MSKTILIFLYSFNLCFSFPVKSLQEIHNKNVVRQHFEESCGASSLATLLNFFTFQQYTEQELLALLGQKTDMLSFKELQQLAINLGYDIKGFQLSRDILEQTSYPLLVKIENDPRYPHFVVIVNYQGDFIRVLDPSFGEYKATKKEFYSTWDKDGLGGYALIIVHKENKPLIKDLEFPNERFLSRIKTSKYLETLAPLGFRISNTYRKRKL